MRGLHTEREGSVAIVAKELYPGELEDLRTRLKEAEETLEAIQNGGVDAIVVSGKTGEQVYTLHGADESYRYLVESISEGAITLTTDGIILYGNHRFAEMLGLPLDQIIGTPVLKYVSDDDQHFDKRIFLHGDPGIVRFQSTIKTRLDGKIAVQISLRVADIAGGRTISVIITDLTDQKRVEGDLRAAELRERTRAAELQALLDAVPGIVLIAQDPECRRIIGNRTATELFELPPHANVSKSAPDDEKPTTYRTMRNGVEIPPEALPVCTAAKGRDIRDYELDIVKNNGVVRTIIGNASPVFDENGNPQGAIGVFVDITEHKKTIEDLYWSRQSFKALVENLPDIISRFDRKYRHLYVSPSIMNVTCIAADDYIGKTNEDLAMPSELCKQWNAVLGKVFASGKGQTTEFVFPSDHGLISYEFKVVPEFAPDGSIPTVLSRATDVTMRKRAEAALRESEERYRSLIADMNIGFALCEMLFDDSGTPYDYRILETNEAYDIQTGLKAANVIGKTVLELFPDFEKSWIDIYGKVVITGEKIRFENFNQNTGKFYDAFSFRQAKGKFAVLFMDITERKQLEEELKRHRGQLEELVEERTVELEAKNITLQELNITLRTLLKQREDDKRDMEERFVMNVRDLVLPYVGHLKKGPLDVRQQTYLEIMEKHLNDIATPLLKNVRQFNLTPREVQVAALVSQGKSTKEIAKLLGAGSRSISTHRKSIRKKLGLGAKQENLQSYLNILDH